MSSEPKAPSPQPKIGPFAQLIFGSRWLQVPLYVGLIVAQAVYVLLFLKELWHLVAHSFDASEQQIMLNRARADRRRHDLEPAGDGDRRRL
jgi:uncharacterized membrane protein YqhA